MRLPRRALLASTLALGFTPLAAFTQPTTPASTPAPAVPPEPALRVIVSIPPLKGLVQPLLPASSTIDVLIPPGVSEHGYEIPLPKLAELNSAHIVVTVGLNLEPQIDKFLAQHPRQLRREVVFAKVVEDALKGPAAPAHAHDHGDHDHHDHKPAAPPHASNPAPSTPQPKHGETGHVHGPDCDHAHGPSDPHLWLDPALAMRLVPAVSAAIDDALRGSAPSSTEPVTRAAWSSALDQRKEALLDRLRALDAEYAKRLAQCPKKSLIVAHDAWGWLAKRYGLTTIPIAGLTASEPTPKAIAEVVKAAREQQLPAIFFEPQISPAAAQRVAKATNLKLLRLDPLGSGDYFALMHANLKALIEGLGGR